ncbi:MAG: glutaminase A [Verrucomicrobiota bacterium]
MSDEFFSELKSASPIQDYLQYLHDKFKSINDGEVASYIPELATADPNWFGISIVTMDGHLYEVGDTRIPFTIQSISKPFVYGLALEDHGRTDVLNKIGVEPSGEAFNSISLRPETGQPFNPMINAGAIAATGLVEGHTPDLQFQRILDLFHHYTGHPVEVDERVYQSESSTGHRNRAIAYMLRNFDIIQDDPSPILENYFKQCSISVTGNDLAVIAGTLANAGINPLNGRRAIRSEYVENVLSIMGTCGMYDYAGEWIYRVGMPAKSGVAGGIVAVLPGQLGIGIYSPPLDPKGNSVRGIQTCHQLSMDFNLHMFNVPHSTQSVIRTSYWGSELGSDRVRPLEERLYLKKSASKILVYELQGDLNFSTAEIVVRKINESFKSFEFLVINLKRILHIDESACKLFLSLYLRMKGMNKTLIFSESSQHRLLQRIFKANMNDSFPTKLFIDSHAAALEVCENTLLLGHSGQYGGIREQVLAKHEFLADLSPDEMSIVEAMMKPQSFEKDQEIVAAGSIADEIFLLTSGTVTVCISLPDGRLNRLASFSAGVTFGELAMGGANKRSASVYADTEVECFTLSLEDLDQLEKDHPAIQCKLLRNVLRLTTNRLESANRSIGALL